MVTDMITMSSVLFCISVYTLYDFWKETDEQKIEKAKNAISKFDKIKTISPGGSTKPDMVTDLTNLKKALEEGASIDKENDLQYHNKITEIEDYLVKSDELKRQKDKALEDIEMSKITKISEQQSKSLSAVTARKIVGQFNTMKDEQKIDEICKYAKSSTAEDKYIYEELQKTPFYKQNTKKIVATCGGTLKEYQKELDQEQRVKDYEIKLTKAITDGNRDELIRLLEEVCKMGITGKDQQEIFDKIKGYDNKIRELGLTPENICALGPPAPLGSETKRIVTMLREARAKMSNPSPSPSSGQEPPGQVSSGQAP